MQAVVGASGGSGRYVQTDSIRFHTPAGYVTFGLFILARFLYSIDVIMFMEDCVATVLVLN